MLLRRHVSVALDANTMWWLRLGARHKSITSSIEITDALRPGGRAAMRSVTMTMWRSGIELSADNTALAYSLMSIVDFINTMFFL